MAGRLRRGDVFLYRCASPDKERPVVVLTSDNVIDHMNSVTVAPISSTIRDVRSQVVLDESDGMKFPCSVNLHRVITVPAMKLGPRVATLQTGRMKEICVALNKALGCS